MINWMRTGTAALVGVGSAAAEKWMPTPLVFGQFSSSWAAIAEVAAFGTGMLVDVWSPRYPNLSDGLMDGGAALAARRLTKNALAQASAQAFHPIQAGARPMAFGPVAGAIRVGAGGYGGYQPAVVTRESRPTLIV